jgi:hypothetical protein
MHRPNPVVRRASGRGPAARSIGRGAAVSSGLLGVALIACLSSASTARAADAAKPERGGGPTGVGFELGDLNGVSLKYWASPEAALQLRLGSATAVSAFNSLGISATFAYHFRPIEVADHSYSLPFYVGGGGRFTVASTTNTYIDGGLVGVVGMSVLVPGMPVEIFVEVRPQAVLYNPAVDAAGKLKVGFNVEGGMGVHYYF